ncbi:hypothetical protein LT493_19695 [Streptomyces tricolor]|nr:hypothetical protein [Streptomyces tricolor]
MAESARYQQALEKGDKKVVGVNVHTGSVTGDLESPAGQPRGGAGAGCGCSPSGRRRGTRRRCGERWTAC